VGLDRRGAIGPSACVLQRLRGPAVNRSSHLALLALSRSNDLGPRLDPLTFRGRVSAGTLEYSRLLVFFIVGAGRFELPTPQSTRPHQVNLLVLHKLFARLLESAKTLFQAVKAAAFPRG
jgi:hypothetical protein